MTEKIAWLEEVLVLEPSSKLFFPLARAYVQDSRHDDALALLRKGLTFHPEHLEARLLLIECLRHTSDVPDLDLARITAAELEPLILKLSAYPAFWKGWAARCRADGQTEMALTLEMLAGQLNGTTLTWGAILEQGLQAVIAQSEKAQAPGHSGPASTKAPLAASPVLQELSQEIHPETSQGLDTPATQKSSEPPSPDLSKPARELEVQDGSGEGEQPASEMDIHFGAELETGEVSKREQGRKPELKPESPDDSSPSSDARSAPTSEDFPDPSERVEEISPGPEVAISGPGEPGHLEAHLTEGERRYYETKTYADLLAKQGEHEEALSLYTKLLQSSPDEDNRRDLETRIHELQERIAKNPKDAGAKEKPLQEDPGETSFEDNETMAIDKSPGPSSKSTRATQTLIKLADRLESRAAK